MYGRVSSDSAQRPLGNVDYSQAGVHDPKYGYGAGYGEGYSNANPRYTQAGKPKRSKKWIWIVLLIVLVLAIVGGVAGGILGTRSSKNDSSTSSQSNGSGSGSGSGSSSGGGSSVTGSAVGSTPSATKGTQAVSGSVLPIGTTSFGNPIYPLNESSTVKISAPTVIQNASLSCGNDPYTFADPTTMTVRNEHPLLFAPAYKWECLPKLVANDPYMSYWNTTIMNNATLYYNMPPTNYSIDGCLSCSGVLDVARQVQLKIKHWGYAWKMTNDTKWADRAWTELNTAMGGTSQYFGVTGDNWNSQHFLDVGEFTMAFALGYDWFWDAWQDSQKTALRTAIVDLGLNYGIQAYTNTSVGYGWWTKVNGNWNCVCNNGLAMGALAIANEDTTGTASQILQLTVPNAAANCAFFPNPDDGVGSETAAYWHFATTGHAQMAAGLLSATGSTQNLLDSNPGMKLSSLFHMYVTGNQGPFDYGDNGPNKYTATANGLFFYANQYSIPQYALYQRDRGDAPEPMSMMFYDPQVSGSFFDGLALDHQFTNSSGAFVSMRSSWTDTTGVYVALKSSKLEGHQTHGDVDGGDFVLDALGIRWAGEYGSGNYLSDGYFTSEAQDAERWLYYRKRTEGQNTITFPSSIQNVLAVPTAQFGSTGEVQDALAYTAPNASTAFYTTDLSTFYNGTAAMRGIRLLNGRRQVLLQDEITVPSGGAQWRLHTNATVAISTNGQTATLTRDGQTLIAEIQAPSTLVFGTAQPIRSQFGTDPALPNGGTGEDADQPNPTVTVLTIDMPAGAQVLPVLFNPQWSDFNANSYVTPPEVALASWSLTSHGV